jgi:hypothetical protein
VTYFYPFLLTLRWFRALLQPMQKNQLPPPLLPPALRDCFATVWLHPSFVSGQTDSKSSLFICGFLETNLPANDCRAVRDGAVCEIDEKLHDNRLV